MGKNIHVVPKGKQWAVKEAGKPQPLSIHRKQSTAINAGKPAAISRQSELIVHRPTGEIRSKDSFGNDPNPPKDLEH